MLQLFLNVQCALMLPPKYRRSPSKFQPPHWLRLKWKLRTYLPGLSLRHWSQLLTVFSSARRMNPRSLLSKPGVLKPTFELKRTRSPEILPNANGAGMAAERRRRRIELDVVGVGTLIAVDVVLLQPGDRFGAVDAAAGQVAGEV